MPAGRTASFRQQSDPAIPRSCSCVWPSLANARAASAQPHCTAATPCDVTFTAVSQTSVVRANRLRRNMGNSGLTAFATTADSERTGGVIGSRSTRI